MILKSIVAWFGLLGLAWPRQGKPGPPAKPGQARPDQAFPFCLSLSGEKGERVSLQRQRDEPRQAKPSHNGFQDHRFV